MWFSKNNQLEEISINNSNRSSKSVFRFYIVFENENCRTSHSDCYLPKVEIKYYNVNVDGRNFLDQLINNNIKKHGNFRKLATGQGDYYTTGHLLDYFYFKEDYKMIEMDLTK